MVFSFSYGEWVEICRNVPSMPVCNLFLHQQLAILPPAQFPSALALPDRSAQPQIFDIAIGAAGVGVRSVCAIPRMQAAGGGYPGSAGNAANIVACGLAVILGVVLAIQAGRRQAAVARSETRILFGIFALQSLFQLLSTGSFIRQNTAAIVWVTAIQLALVLLLFWTIAWCTFLCIQLIEDGTLASFIPYVTISVVLFIGFFWICLDTGFSVSGYFDTTPDSLKNNWIFTILIVLCGAFVVFSIVVSIWVSGMYLRERRPLLLYGVSLFFFALSQGALWALSQVVCIRTDSKIDGSWISTVCVMISMIFLYLGWKSVTEDYWDEVNTERMSEYGGDRYSSVGNPLLQGGNSGSLRSNRGMQDGTYPGSYVQQTTPLQSNYPYSER